MVSHKIFFKARKGIFYSIMTLLLLAPIIALIIFFSQTTTTTSQRIVVKAVGLELTNFVESIEVDLPRALEISGKSAVAASVNHVISNGVPANDGQARVTELALNGSYNGFPSILMSNNSLSAWRARLEGKGTRFGLNVSTQVTGFSAVPLDGFDLLFSVTLLVNASSPAYSINFSREFNATKIISVEGIEDPLYALKNRGLVHRVFSANSSRVYGVAALDAAASGEEYVTTNDSACFFDRLEGNNTLSAKYSAQSVQVIGLETFVNTNDLKEQEIDVNDNASVVDHLYFNETQKFGWPVNESTLSWLKLDDAHAALYGVTLIK